MRFQVAAMVKVNGYGLARLVADGDIGVVMAAFDSPDATSNVPPRYDVAFVTGDASDGSTYTIPEPYLSSVRDVPTALTDKTETPNG